MRQPEPPSEPDCNTSDKVNLHMDLISSPQLEANPPDRTQCLKEITSSGLVRSKNAWAAYKAQSGAGASSRMRSPKSVGLFSISRV